MNAMPFHIDTLPELPAGSRSRIIRPEVRHEDGRWSYQWDVVLDVPGNAPLTLGGAWFRSDLPVTSPGGTANAALVASMLPLMMIGAPVVVEGGVSPRLLRHLQMFQTAFAAWFPGLRRVAIDAAPLSPDTSSETPAPTAGTGEGVLFSLGVDSWYSVLRHRRSIDRLVFIDGFDLTSEQAGARVDMRAAATEAAAAVGKPLAVVETNLRDWLDRWLDWSVSHGTVLGAVVMMLEGSLARVWLPSSGRTWEPVAVGSNPFTDPLYATEYIRATYDGGEVQRVAKLAWLLEQPVAMENLRVCWSGIEGRRNCGRCPKCVRTMAALHLLGGLPRATLFPPTIDPDVVRKPPMWSPVGIGLRNDGRTMLDHARALGLEQDPVAVAMAEGFHRARVEGLMAPDGALALMADHEDWAQLARLDRNGLADDLMTHAPDLVTRALEPAVDKVPREVFRTLWQRDRGWLLRQVAKLRQS